MLFCVIEFYGILKLFFADFYDFAQHVLLQIAPWYVVFERFVVDIFDYAAIFFVGKVEEMVRPSAFDELVSKLLSSPRFEAIKADKNRRRRYDRK